MLTIIEAVTAWQAVRKSTIFMDNTIGLVPTMGNLHAGHQSLLQRAKQENDITVLTIFVNPTQFNDPADLANYPKTFANDIQIAEANKIDYVFAPCYQDMYPDQYHYKISESELSKKLCGQYRAGHFDGVLTIVLKLLQLVKAHNAYFGEKDYQQLQLVKGLTEAFFIDTKIIACPTVRDENGLALSSRNNLLSNEQLALARHFPALLGSKLTIVEIIKQLTALNFSVEYVEEHFDRRFGAVKLGNVRLIDNFRL